MAPAQRHDAALGRALETREAQGVTERYSLMAATAAERRGLAPRCGQRDRPRGHGDGRDHRDEAPGAQVGHRTRGSSRDHRPDVNHVRWARLVAQQAGIPLLMQRRSGQSRAAPDVGEAVRVPRHPWHTTDGLPSLVADRARSRAAHRQPLAQTPMTWITRVPATWSPAHAVLAPATPQSLAALTAGDRDDAWPASDGGLEPRGVLSASARRQAQARRTVDRPWRPPRDQATNALQTGGRTPWACAAEARPARSPFERDVPTVELAARTVRAPPR